jgi:hypothetical protein
LGEFFEVLRFAQDDGWKLVMAKAEAIATAKAEAKATAKATAKAEATADPLRG